MTDQNKERKGWEKEFDHPHGEFGDYSGNVVKGMISKDRARKFIAKVEREAVRRTLENARAEIHGMMLENPGLFRLLDRVLRLPALSLAKESDE